MKAIVLNENGSTRNFSLVEMEKPKAIDGHVVIEVCASSLNPVDCKIRNGMLAAIGPDLPGVLHGDVAGIVTEIGDGVERFKVGDEVYGCIGGFKGMPGVLSEFALADAKLLARKPENLSMSEAASLPLVGITSWNALIDRANIKNGQRVLVHAGTGGVGHFALQLAKAMGAETHSTVSSYQKANLAKDLGADEVINYSELEVQQYVQKFTGGIGYDLVFDTVGGKCLDHSFKAAKEHGTVVSIAARSEHDLTPVHTKSLSLHVVFMLLPILRNTGRESHGETLTKIRDLVEQAKIKPLLHEQRFSFEEAGRAHECWEAGNAIGKIVLENKW
jgi:NADPH2:quinone reductase